MVVDVFIPARRFGEFWDWYRRDFNFWPLWIVPYRIAKPYPWISDAHRERMGETLFIDAAVYGKPNSDPDVDWSEVLEKKTFELGGIKTLISRNHYDAERFWSIYSQPRYRAAKARLDPGNLFGDLFAKMSRRGS